MSIFHVENGFFLANQKYRRLTTSYFFYFWWKTAPIKYLVPWMLKSPLTYVLKKTASQLNLSLRTEVWGNLTYPRNQIFLGCCFPPKIKKKYDVVSLLYLWWAEKPVLSMKYWHCWLLLKMYSEGVFSNNQPCQYFMERTGFLAHQRYKRLTTSYFFDFWWKTAS